MAEGETAGKQKESSQAIKMLSDNDFQDLLEETINIKTVSLQGKSPILQRLLSEVKVDDDDFKSNFKEMAVAAGSRGTVGKKPRTERKRNKDEQHQRGSAAARSTQGGSLQNLSRKQDGDGRPRDKLKKSGSVNSFMATESRSETAPTSTTTWYCGNLKGRSRSQVTKSAVNDTVKPARQSRNAASAVGPAATSDASSLDRKNSKGSAARGKKCNYGSMSCDDCVSDPGYLSSCELERKCSPVWTGDRSRWYSESNCSDSEGLIPKGLTGEDVEEMDVDQYENSGDEELTEESLLLKSTTNNPAKTPNKVSKKVYANTDSLPNQINSQRQKEDVDRGISIPIRIRYRAKLCQLQTSQNPTQKDREQLQQARYQNKCSDKGTSRVNVERGENCLYSPLSAFSEQTVRSISLKQDENHSKAKGDCFLGIDQHRNDIECDGSHLRTRKNVKSEMIISNNFGQGDGKLDENGNPVDEGRGGNWRYSRKDDSADTERSVMDSDKRRKPKRAKATLKEMKAGDISGNRGNEPVDSLLEFINSTEKKGKPVSTKCNITDATNKKSALHKNNIKVPNGKSKKQEKENNKRNLPDLRLSVDLTNDVIVPCAMDKDSIYDLLDDNEHCSDSISRESSELSDTKLVINGSKRLANQKLSLEDDNDSQDYIPSKNAVFIKNNVVVRKAHSWESETVPIPSLGEYGFSADEEQDVHISCDMIKMHPSRMVIQPARSESYDSAGEVSSFVADFYAVADVPQVVEDSEFHVVTKRQRRSKMRSDGYVLRNNKRSSAYSGCGFSDDRDFSRLPWSRPEDMMLLAGMTLSHRGQRSGSESRRKSTSSMPPSDHSSVDNSDLDSVHSLPVKSTTVKPTIIKTSSSSSNTPQASYADIAKMAASSLPQRSSRIHSAPLSKTPSSEISLALPMIDVNNYEVARSHISHPSLFLSISSINSENKRDASTSTTDDIPTARSSSPSLYGAPITHWASYPTLAEATGKNGAKSGGGVTVQSDGDRSSATGKSGDSGSSSYSRKSPSSGTCPESTQRNCDPATNGASLLARGQRRRSTDGGPPMSVHPFVNEPKCSSASIRDKEKNAKDVKGSGGDNPVVTDDLTQQCSAVMPNKPTATSEPPCSNSSVATIGASSSIVSETLPSATLSLKASTSDLKGKGKSVKKGSSKSLPAVVIMNNYEPLPCFSDFTFGFEINEQLLLMSTPTNVAEGSFSLSSPSSSPSPDSAATTTEAVMSPTDVCGSPSVVVAGGALAPPVAVESRCNSLLLASGEGELPNSRSNSPHLSAMSIEEDKEMACAPPPQTDDLSSFNYENVIDYITHTWDDVIKEYETETKLSSNTKIQYHVKERLQGSDPQ